VKTTRDNRTRRRKIGDAIRKRRETLGLSQEGLAEVIDCHRNYVGLVERGEHNVSIEMIARFADAFKCRASDLIREAGF
jgi:transcriptional regulator with XRE-family HTH domain